MFGTYIFKRLTNTEFIYTFESISNVVVGFILTSYQK